MLDPRNRTKVEAVNVNSIKESLEERVPVFSSSMMDRIDNLRCSLPRHAADGPSNVIKLAVLFGKASQDVGVAEYSAREPMEELPSKRFGVEPFVPLVTFPNGRLDHLVYIRLGERQ